MKRKMGEPTRHSLLFPDAALLGSCGSCGAGFSGGGAMDMADALLRPPQLLLMLVMVLTQALAGSALVRLGACWNGIISSCRKIVIGLFVDGCRSKTSANSKLQYICSSTYK